MPPDVARGGPCQEAAPDNANSPLPTLQDAADITTALAGSAERDAAEMRSRIAWARDCYRIGVEDGIEAGRGQALEEEAQQRREAHGMVRSAMRNARIERDRWTLRGERRTRLTFGQPHPDDYPGRGAA